MNKITLLAATLFLSSISFAGPSCTWDLESTESKNINGNQLVIDRFDCRDEPGWSSEYTNDIYKARIINAKGKVITLEDSDNYEAVRLLPDAPLNALRFSWPGSSNIGNSIRVYDRDWRQIKTLHGPVNEYQANNRKGNEYKVIGFFEIDKNYYIENLRSLGGKCNACQQYVVDTYKVVNDSLIVVDTRDYNIANYKSFVE